MGFDNTILSIRQLPLAKYYVRTIELNIVEKASRKLIWRLSVHEVYKKLIRTLEGAIAILYCQYVSTIARVGHHSELILAK